MAFDKVAPVMHIEQGRFSLNCGQYRSHFALDQCIREIGGVLFVLFVIIHVDAATCPNLLGRWRYRVSLNVVYKKLDKDATVVPEHSISIELMIEVGHHSERVTSSLPTLLRDKTRGSKDPSESVSGLVST